MPELQHPGENAPVITTAARPASQADVLEAHRRAGRRFQAAGVGSFVREQGRGPAVLCLHGMIGSSFLYRKVLAELAARGLRGVAFDLPGFGLADRPPGYDYSWTGLGRFCVAAVDSWPWTASIWWCMTSAARSASSSPPPCPPGSCR